MSFSITKLSSCLLVSASLLGGCSTITTGSSQQISVTTPDAEGATCELKSPDGQYFVTTPGSVTVSKSKHNIAVKCQKDGYTDGIATIGSDFEVMTFGNILFGGVIGVGVDAASGALNEYPDSVQVQMQKIKPANPQDPANAVTEDNLTMAPIS